jgi:beta-propeller uncharacterized protein DUF5122
VSLHLDLISAGAGCGCARRTWVHVVVLLVVLALAGPARAQIPDPNLWFADGSVLSMALSGSTLYIGGTFTHVGPNTGGFVGFDASGGTRRRSWPRVDGTVFAAVQDGGGGWYIGGYFGHVAGVPRSNLAHVRADGTLDGWNPGANGYVRVLAVGGSAVYAAGGFSSIGGQARAGIAALDVGTGLATAWNPSVNGRVSALAVGGSTVYVGGGFTSIGGQTRSNVAALDAGTGLATNWDPGANDIVQILTVNGPTIYAGGWFTAIGGQLRGGIAALDATTGFATPWNPGTSGVVSAIAVSGSTVYTGGGFSHIGGQARSDIAALDATTGLATPWNPGANMGVYAIAVSGSTIYVGGSFTAIGGQNRNHVAALDATTGLATAWNPGADDIVWTVSPSGSTVCAGGEFKSIGAQARNRIAALDITTGLATEWNPAAVGPVAGPLAFVGALAVSGSTVYVGGSFTSVGGQGRSNIAALDVTTGLATAWNPGADGDVYALAVSGSKVYAGGHFTRIGGQARSYIAALETATGLATAWNPGVGGAPVRTLALSGPTIYAGGDSQFGNIAAFDVGTGATVWHSGANDVVIALATSDSAVYAGGLFGYVGLQHRNGIAALDAKTGLPTAWNPGGITPENPYVYALATSGSTVYAGGNFSRIGGQARSSIAALDAATGHATAWNPGVDDIVTAFAVSGSTVYVGGAFTTIGGLAAPGVARIFPAPGSPPIAAVLSPNGGETLSIGTTHRLTWAATTSAPGVESVDLYLSRSGAIGPWELLAAGAANTGAYDWTVTGPATSGTCYLWVDARDYGGNVGSDVSDAGFTIASGALAVDAAPGDAAFALGPVAPNPTRGPSRLSYLVPRRAHVRLTLLDVQGRELAVLADGARDAGRYTLPLDGAGLRPGLYFIRMRAPETDLKQRIVILK